MSKIICDVCGSSYSENATQCPICGTAKSDSAKPAAESVVEEPAIKGGKFSKNNVSKPVAPAKSAPSKDNKGESQSNLPMIIIVTVLLLAIVAVCVFIAVRFMDKPENPNINPTGITTTAPTTPDPTQPSIQNVPCTGIELVGYESKTLSFSAVGESAKLSVKALPENTTEVVTYTFVSSNPAVVLVDATGTVTPVANGSATITVSYADFSIVLDVTVDLPVVLTELKLNSADITLSPTYGLTWDLFKNTENGGLEAADIEWVSSDTDIVTVTDGVVNAVRNGKATITATYDGLTATCKVIVAQMNAVSKYVLVNQWSNSNDSTMKVGEELEIWLKDTDGNPVKNLTWTPSNDFPKCCSFVSTEKGVKITANNVTTNVSGGYVFIQTVIEGETYKYIIRVTPAPTEG